MNIVPMIVLVNGDDSRTAIWHVDVGPPLAGMSRLGGAWVTDNGSVYGQVVTGRHVFLFGGVVPASVEAWVGSVIDVPGTLTNIRDWIAEHNRLHEASRTEKGNERAPLNWPRLPEPLDWDALPAPPRGVVDDKLIAETIVAAHWIADLAQTWQAIETLRLSRDHLKGGDVESRILPFALVQRVPA
ncbi:MAG: hypothetical protein ACOYB7_02530 [Mycobacterium sp.]